jgi:sugar phosphate isomerase/epimerase
MCLSTLLDDPATCDAADLARIVRASAAAGFRSVALWSWQAAAMGVGTACAILDDAGVTARLAECRTRWAEGPDAAVEQIDEQLDVLGALGAEMMLAVSKQTTMDMARAVEGFAALCERAGQRGIRVAIEFIPCRALHDLATAWQVVRDSHAPNGGIVLDMMHWQYQPGGPDLELLRGIPGEHVHFVQVCDAAAGAPPPADDYIATAMRARPLPGDGVVDIPALLDAIAATGADPFFALEVFSADLLAGGAESMAARLRGVADALFPPAGRD